MEIPKGTRFVLVRIYYFVCTAITFKYYLLDPLVSLRLKNLILISYYMYVHSRRRHRHNMAMRGRLTVVALGGQRYRASHRWCRTSTIHFNFSIASIKRSRRTSRGLRRRPPQPPPHQRCPSCVRLKDWALGTWTPRMNIRRPRRAATMRSLISISISLGQAIFRPHP